MQTPKQTREKARSMGYTPPQAVLAELKRLSKRNGTQVMVFTAILDHMGVLFLIILGLEVAYLASPFLVLAAHALIWPTISVFMRGLENLTHYGSHGHFDKSNRKLNDLLCNILAAFPTFMRTQSYRESHSPHHVSFGTVRDPDLARYESIRLEKIERGNLLVFALEIGRRIPRYAWEYWIAIKVTPLALVCGLLWHFCVYFMSVTMLVNWKAAVIIYCVYIVVPMIFLIPLRMIAESDDHTYSDGSTVFDATPENHGIIHRLTHPHDLYHDLHHLYPQLLYCDMPEFASLLRRYDPDGYKRRVRMRFSLLDRPS